MTKHEIEQSIKYIEESKLTHEIWLNHYYKYPEDESIWGPSIGDIEHQKKYIEQYNYVINILTKIKQLFEENIAYATCGCCGGSGWSGT